MTDADETASSVVKAMLAKDRFTRWLGASLIELRPGTCTVAMTVRDEMLNGFDVCHGGVTFSLADSALAFASNSHGRVAVSIETGMAYPEPVHVGDILTAVAEERTCGNRVAVYEVTVTKNTGTVVGVFRGTVYRTDKEIFPSKGGKAG